MNKAQHDGRALRVARSNAEMTQGELGQRSGISPKSIKQWEVSESDIPAWAIERITEHAIWPTHAEVHEALSHSYMFAVSGLTTWQLKQKMKAMGRYLDGVVEVSDIS